MRLKLVALLIAGFVALPWLHAAAVNDAALWRPRLATPAIVALDSDAHREFVAEVRAAPTAREWTATLANDLRSWQCQVVKANYLTINRGTEPGWRVVVRVPADVAPELFVLKLASSEASSTQNQAVSVIPAFATDFYLLHITDEQIVSKTHTDPSGQFHKGVGTWDEMMWMQEPVNLINPRCVIITGDQIDFNGALDGWNNWVPWGYQPPGHKLFTEQETTAIEERLCDMYMDCHRGYHVAYVETPGNHDVAPPGKKLKGTDIDWHPRSASVYEARFGQRSWSFRMDDFYVLMHDWSDAGLERWSAEDFDAAGQDAGVTYRLVGQHFHDRWNGAPTGNAAFRPATCDLMLIGHGHVEATIQTTPYFIYEDGPAFKYGETGYFNFRRAAHGWTCDQTQGPRDPVKDYWPLFTDHGQLKKVRCDQPDARAVATTSVTITNDLPQTFYDGRVRFVLPKGKYDNVQNGTILAEYDSTAGDKTAVLVKVKIPAEGAVTVSVGNGAATRHAE